MLNSYQTLDIAETEFKRAIAEDDELHARYREWCRENGSTERNGFTDFCREYIAAQDSVWESLNDYNDYD